MTQLLEEVLCTTMTEESAKAIDKMVNYTAKGDGLVQLEIFMKEVGKGGKCINTEDL